MKVIHLNLKSKSPKNEIQKINRILNSKSKNSSKNNKDAKTRNIVLSSNICKNKNNFKRIFSNNNNYINFSSNNCISTNTTNFHNSKTNNFIFFEHYFNFKDIDNLNQIKSLKHHSSGSISNFNTNFSNIKFINNNYIREKDVKKKKSDFINNFKNIKENVNNNDLLALNKNDKLYINTNYSVLLNNNPKKDKKKIYTKIQNLKNCFNFYNSRPLTLNFSNEFNNFNSYKILLNNKSLKNINKYQPNYRKKLVINDSILKVNNKGNSTNKESKKKLLKENQKIKCSKSYNFLLNNKTKKLSSSTSFSPMHNIQPKNKNSQKKFYNDSKKMNNRKLLTQGIKNNSTECVQINLYNKKNKYNRNNNNNNGIEKKHPSVKTSENKINIKYFNRIDNRKSKINDNKKNDFILTQKTNLFSKKIKNRNINHNNFKINDNYISYYKKNINNSKIKGINNNNTSIMTPEQNHYFAVKQIQQVKKNNNKYI